MDPLVRDAVADLMDKKNRAFYTCAVKDFCSPLLRT